MEYRDSQGNGEKSEGVDGESDEVENGEGENEEEVVRMDEDITLSMHRRASGKRT